MTYAEDIPAKICSSFAHNMLSANLSGQCYPVWRRNSKAWPLIVPKHVPITIRKVRGVVPFLRSSMDYGIVTKNEVGMGYGGAVQEMDKKALFSEGKHLQLLR
jgi:hypothetical protein